MRSRNRSNWRRVTRLRLLQLAGRALPSRSTGDTHKLLLVRPDHIGDVLLTAPAVGLLRASLPNAHLTYMVGPWSSEAARHGPPVDEVRTLNFPGFTRQRKANLVAPYALLATEALHLRRARYDLAVVFRPDHWWGALLTAAAGIPIRIGVATPETEPLLTHSYRPTCDEHAAERSLAIARLALEAIGTPPAEPGHVAQFNVSDSARQEGDAIWLQHKLTDRRVVAIHPSAGALLKSWPNESWARLADAVIDQNVAVLFTGAPSDRSLLQDISKRMERTGAVVACGQSLGTSAALYQRCTLAITVDSGAAHLAAAVGTPTVRLYGPAPPSIFGPWPARLNDHVLITRGLSCAPCGQLELPPCGARALPACMLALSVDDVLNVVKAEIGEG